MVRKVIFIHEICKGKWKTKLIEGLHNLFLTEQNDNTRKNENTLTASFNDCCFFF